MKRLKTERLLLILLIISMIFHVFYGIKVSAVVYELEINLKRQSRQIEKKDIQIQIQDMLLDIQDDLIQKYIIDEQETEPVEVQEKEYIGEFEITYYTAGPESTGKSPEHPQYGITKSGTRVKEGQTIATDWSVLPAGTKVFIEGLGERIVEDIGGAIKGFDIDVYVEDVEVAKQLGRHKADVWIIREENYGKDI